MQTFSFGPPPAFPTLPESVVAWEKKKVGNAVKAALRELRGEWPKLKDRPTVIVDLMRRSTNNWRALVKSVPEAEALDELKGACLFVLWDADYPSKL
jgi:hypothetical protein